MRLTKSTLTRAAIMGAALTGLVAGLTTPAIAAAKPIGAAAPTVAQSLATALGARTAGSYLDASGALVVTVTDDAAAAQVRQAGAVARMVSRSGAQLAGAVAELTRSASVPGTAWAIDPASNQVLVSLDSSVSGARLAAVTA